MVLLSKFLMPFLISSSPTQVSNKHCPPKKLIHSYPYNQFTNKGSIFTDLNRYKNRKKDKRTQIFQKKKERENNPEPTHSTPLIQEQSPPRPANYSRHFPLPLAASITRIPRFFNRRGTIGTAAPISVILGDAPPFVPHSFHGWMKRWGMNRGALARGVLARDWVRDTVSNLPTECQPPADGR